MESYRTIHRHLGHCLVGKWIAIVFLIVEIWWQEVPCQEAPIHGLATKARDTSIGLTLIKTWGRINGSDTTEMEMSCHPWVQWQSVLICRWIEGSIVEVRGILIGCGLVEWPPRRR
jgi:hypothetical protein